MTLSIKKLFINTLKYKSYFEITCLDNNKYITNS